MVSPPPGEGGGGNTLGAATTRVRAGQGRRARGGAEEPQQERWVVEWEVVNIIIFRHTVQGNKWDVINITIFRCVAQGKTS